MKPIVIHFSSAIVALLLSYLVNQLPNIPDALKPWVPFGMVPLMVLTVWFVVEQSNAGARSTTKIIGNKVAGKGAKMRVRDAEVVNNELTGEDTEITTNDGTSGSGRNP